jgi:hypothetical protein
VVEEVRVINVLMVEQHHQEEAVQVEMDQVFLEQEQLIQVVVEVEEDQRHVFQDQEVPADQELLL